jgi:hypothetical protein
MNKFKVRIILRPNFEERRDTLSAQFQEYFDSILCQYIVKMFDHCKNNIVVDCILTEEQVDNLPGKNSPYVTIVKEEYKKVKNEWDYFNDMLKSENQ